mmetsp:Transcript_102715/g.257522  ORF Transcript_102715/g.257522 Transcript_102715/m.257522 type:complete len:227 (+) Transcript_102715:546-1226(+)
MRWQGPTSATWPPAFRIRSSSALSSGLWSSDSPTAFPPRQTTARESPQFATAMRHNLRAVPLPLLLLLLLPVSEELLVSPYSTSATTAVLPTRLKAFFLSPHASMRPSEDCGGREGMPSPPLRKKESIVSIARCSDFPICEGNAHLPSSPSAAAASSPAVAAAGSAGSAAVASEADEDSFPLPSDAPAEAWPTTLEAQAARTFGNSTDVIWDTCAPPWPSKTAKRA